MAINEARLRAIAIGGTRGRGSRKAPYGPVNDDGPSGRAVVTRLTTDPKKGGASTYSFPSDKSLTKKNLQPGDQGRHVLGSKGR